MLVEPIDVTAIVAIVMGLLVILIPVAGLTARFAMKPIVDAIARMRESQSDKQIIAMLERRVALLEQQLQGVEHAVSGLSEEAEFQRRLKEPEELGGSRRI